MADAEKDKKDMKKGAKDKAAEKPAEAPKKEGDNDKDKKGGGEKKKEKATVTVLAMNGDTLRRFKTDIDSLFGYVTWDMDTKGVRFPTNNEPDKDNLEPGNGPQAGPGTYKVVVKYGAYIDSTMVRVLDDPRMPIPTAQRQAKTDALRDFQKSVDKATKAYNRLKEAEKTIKLVEEQFVNVPDSVKKETIKLGKTLQDSINVLKDAFFMQKEPKGIERNPNALNAKLFNAGGYLNDGTGAPNATTQIAVREAKQAVEKLVERVNNLFDKPWAGYREKAEAVRYSLFKPFDKL
jgi:hypothetical protein